MKKLTHSRLTLSSETLRVLTATENARVIGAKINEKDSINYPCGTEIDCTWWRTCPTNDTTCSEVCGPGSGSC